MQHKLVRMSDRNVLLGFKHSHRLIFSKKVKHSRYRPVEAQRVTGGCGSHTSRQSAHGNGQVVSPTHRRL
jgi:hypothetical protein